MWANSIKNKIQKKKRENSFSPEDYKGFLNFIDQLISEFNF